MCTRLLIIALMIFVAFFSAIYISNLKAYKYFSSPNKIILYENGYKRTYTRFSFKYRKILKALNLRYYEDVTTPMTSVVYKKDLDTMKNKDKVLILEYNNTKISTFKINSKDRKIKYCSIYFPLGNHRNSVIYLLDRKVTNINPLNSIKVDGLNSIDEVSQVLK